MQSVVQRGCCKLQHTERVDISCPPPLIHDVYAALLVATACEPTNSIRKMCVIIAPPTSAEPAALALSLTHSQLRLRSASGAGLLLVLMTRLNFHSATILSVWFSLGSARCSDGISRRCQTPHRTLTCCNAF